MSNSNKRASLRQDDSNKRLSQKQTIYNYLLTNTATASMLSEATGVAHKNITRYKAELQQQGVLWETEQKKCLITGELAWYLSTNLDCIPFSSNQLSLFE